MKKTLGWNNFAVMCWSYENVMVSHSPNAHAGVVLGCFNAYVSNDPSSERLAHPPKVTASVTKGKATRDTPAPSGYLSGLSAFGARDHAASNADTTSRVSS